LGIGPVLARLPVGLDLLAELAPGGDLAADERGLLRVWVSSPTAVNRLVIPVILRRA
jgi:hypothetical protein